MYKILFNRGRLGIVAGRYFGEWLGFRVTLNYNEIILTTNVLTYELTFEFVHAPRGGGRNWKKRSFGFSIKRDQSKDSY